MFGIFKKKTSFIDIWQGTPEMHCHVLPGIDDGAKSPEQSIELLKKYVELGCNSVIATPHTMSGIYDNTPESIRTAGRLLPIIENLKLSFSSEYMLDENFLTLLDQERLLPLKDKILLVEMSFFQPPENLFDILYKIGVKGYLPIMAHPERYGYYHRKFDTYKELKSRGCKLQLNALSLSNHYGSDVQKMAFKLLENGLYDYIGVDTHRMDHLEKIEKILIPQKYANALQLICNKTADAFTIK